MKILLILGLFSCLLNPFTTYSQTEQDSIILLNGRVYRGTILSVSDDLIKYKEIDGKGNEFNSEMSTYRVFSYTQAGQEKITYQQDEFKDNFLTIDEARNATLGSYDARQTFKPRMVFWTSFALGYTAAIFDTYLPQSVINDPDYVGNQTSSGLFKKSPTIFPFFVPVVLSVSWSFPSFKVRESQIIQKHLINDISYYRGFHRVAKQKRMLGALKGSIIGIGAGLITYAVFKP